MTQYRDKRIDRECRKLIAEAFDEHLRGGGGNPRDAERGRLGPDALRTCCFDPDGDNLYQAVDDSANDSFYTLVYKQTADFAACLLVHIAQKGEGKLLDYIENMSELLKAHLQCMTEASKEKRS